jgi:hypothetical protein
MCLKTFSQWLEATQPPQVAPPTEEQPTYNRDVLNSFNRRLQQPGWDSMLFQPEEIAQAQQMINQAKQKVISALGGPIRPVWDQYSAWEKQHPNDMMASPQGNLSPVIKDGGPGVPVQSDQRGITVPSELYKILYWRNVVKLAELNLTSRNPMVLRYLIPKLGSFFKSGF